MHLSTAACLALLAAPAAAQHHWIDPNGGSFHDSGNWSTGVVPGYWGEVNFDLLGSTAYSVSFTSPVHLADALVRVGSVDFDLGGNELQLEQSYRPLLVLDSSTTSWPTLTVRGGRVLVDGPVWVAYYPLFGNLQGSGVLILDGPATALAPLYATGSGGDIQIGNGRNYPAVLEVSNGAICSSGRVIISQGPSILRGDGGAIVQAADVRGLLSPGTAASAVGSLGFGSTLRLRPSSWTEIDLEQAVPGGADVIAVTDTALIEGNLRVRLGAGYVPVVGDQFRILTAGVVNGRFHIVEMPASPVGTQWALEYLPDRVTLGLSPSLTVLTPVPGVAGQQNTITVDQAMDGALIYLAWSAYLGTRTIPQFPGLFLDLGYPVSLAAYGLASGGSIAFVSNVPAAAGGRSYYLQAVEPQSYRTSEVLLHTF
ncbi:MAG: hypothetical protein H8E31_15005 [Planctomycetes bacterium]|nr:hypothetical protein [Planctomycetota bacterium]